jgi:hypothetical protein
MNGLASLSYSITSGPDGNVWFTATGGTGIGPFLGSISPTTFAITRFPVPTGNSPYGMTVGPDSSLWFTEGSLTGRLNPATGAITEYPIPSGQGITTGPEGNLWFTGGSGGVGGGSGGPYIGVPSLTHSQLVVAQQPPSGLAAGASFGVSFQAQDSVGNPITSFNGPVTLGLANNPAGDTLGGTLTVNASGGVATFSGLTLTKAALDTLYASGGGYGWGVTNPITVTPASPSQLVISQQPPATVKVSAAFGLQATIEDPYGNVVTTANNLVTVAFANNPTGATLGGTLSVTASQGVATFSNLTINKTGSGYTLRVSSSGLTSAVSAVINVTKTGKAPVLLGTAAPAAPPDPILVPLVLDSPDPWDGVRAKKRVRSF